jgi:hypothetical protein
MLFVFTIQPICQIESGRGQEFFLGHLPSSNLNHVADHVADQHTSYNIGSSNGSAAQSFS